MNTYKRTFVLFGLAFSGLLLVSSQYAHAECTPADAHRKMQALSLYQTRHQQNYTRHPDPNEDWKIRERIGKLAGETAGVGTTLAQQNYSLACDQYDAIAKKYGVELESLEKEIPDSSLPSTAPAAAAAKKQATCATVSDVSVLNANLLERAQAKSQSTLNSYLSEMGTFADKFTTNPPEACKRLKALKAKYAL